MAQRFNPPPGWQVPAGFAPTQGWQPDPSWPQAPSGWNFWVDDAAGYGEASQGGYGSQPGYGGASPAGGYSPSNPGVQNPSSPGAHGGGNAYDPAPATGQTGPYAQSTNQPGGYDPSMAPGGASMALIEKQVKDNRRGMWIGFAIAAAALLIFLISFGIAASSPTGGTYFRPWWFGLIGLAIGIRGAVSYSKAKKQLAQAQAAAGGGLYGTGMGGSSIPGSGSSGDTPFGGQSGKGDDLYR
ncbi:hypothetical protein [Ruania halotolerans]|uniref:hypothetical protein n=1 Tax=Ruania halotolerans TaxID=2897773 RepID=UPI001E3C67E3|nr:hypothetical protein [Ruania halotolerans]UFU05627.1 hypothetical protein LQF10_14430 [Ruania halotolerans]